MHWFKKLLWGWVILLCMAGVVFGGVYILTLLPVKAALVIILFLLGSVLAWGLGESLAITRRR